MTLYRKRIQEPWASVKFVMKTLKQNFWKSIIPLVYALSIFLKKSGTTGTKAGRPVAIYPVPMAELRLSAIA